MKVIQKYFLALVPPAEIHEKAQEIKIRIRDEFGIKYALKSPPHITLKMPFSYNEAKEELLVEKLREHLKTQEPFSIKIAGVGVFGNRVIFLSVEKSGQLLQLQQQLKVFCKRTLNLTDELSDRNFHPHLTLAFKDLKTAHFSQVLGRIKEQAFEAEYVAKELMLLKRIDGIWISHRKATFGG
jgi:2'-5' RNA ligase